MNIESTKINNLSNETSQRASSQQRNNSSTNFADELKELKNTDTKKSEDAAKSDDNNLDKAKDGLESVVKELNQSEDKNGSSIKNLKDLTDNKNKGENLINNDFNIQDTKDKLPQMNPNMNFAGDGQPFSSFMNNGGEQKDDKLSSSAKELAEEAAILSTMAENIAMANRANALREPEEKTVNRNEGIKRIDTRSGITQETIVKFDSIIMNKADVEVFANLVEQKDINLNNLSSEQIGKSVNISKTLADMLAKAREDNQPIRINFDNDISVIIRISRDGKLTADFLPSSQVAEAYLRENLPLLKQRFDEQNIEYDSLNQRERREQHKENNNKKGRENE